MEQKPNQIIVLRMAMSEAMKDRDVINAWAPVISRAVAKGIFFGSLLLGIIAAAAFVAIVIMAKKPT